MRLRLIPARGSLQRGMRICEFWGKASCSPERRPAAAVAKSSHLLYLKKWVNMQVKIPKKFSLNRQLLTCALCSTIAIILILLFRPGPYISSLFAGMSIFHQTILGIMIGGTYWAMAGIGYKYTANRQATQSAIESYSRLDLSGWNPLWIALAAGFGEELLFRGALQPLVGIWLTSALFVLAHTRAYRFNTLNKRVLLQAFGIFAVSVALCCLAFYAGLVTAIIVHTLLDVVGLCTIRRAKISLSTAVG